jgi:hypothetical protein
MGKIIDNRTDLDQTVRIFDSFYSTNLSVNASEFDLVYSYFLGICETKNIAENFTAVFFRVAQEAGLPVITLLEAVQGSKNKLEMNQTLCYYLNGFKSKTSLYGIGIVPKPNQSVARNVVL